ncbi:Protein abnormal spindle [Dirofilaria immitis]
MMANTSEAKINDEYNEGIAIENDLLTSTPIDNNVYCRTLLQNEFTFTPCHNFTNLKENTVSTSELHSSHFISQSQTFVNDRYDKEDTSFLAPSSSLGIRVIPQKASSVGNIYNSHTGVLMHFSPGTNASNTTMKTKLELLKKRHDLQKTKIKKSSLSYGHIDLHETERNFSSSVFGISNSTNNRQETENIDASVRFPLSTTVNSISDFSKATNATYIVQPLIRTAGRNFVSRCTKTEVDKKSSHLIALSSWLNFLLDEKHDADNNSEILAKSKRDVEQYLRKLLTSKNDIPAMKDNESQNNISYKYFMVKNELNEMRARFRLLYKSSPIPNDIATIVKDNKITVRMDRRVYADIGLQTELLSLFLSFHPFYLRLGLETILSINIEIRADCTNQLRGITYVIAQNIFKNPKIMNNRKYVQGKSKMLINDKGAKALLQHFLTKMCQFLFIVDKAWRDNTISRKNRCLFVKWSAYKSINDVVVMLSRELMSGTSNLPKTLSRLGLFLDRKQGFFEQFQYHVTDLLKDLSNGMILGRTVEILANLPYNTVIHCLRDPGGDRLRKVSNMRTVIDFAKRKSILPKDLYVDIDGIVQGNIDEIIQLLWRFVGKELGDVNELDNCDAEINSISDQLQSLFGISYEIRNPLELADGILFSLLWKQYYSYGIPFELFDGTTVLEQIANAAEYHFGIPSSMLVKWKEAPEEKALCLFTKIFLLRLYECHKFTCAAITIQRAFRRYRINLRMTSDISYKKMFNGNYFYGSDRLARSSQLTAEEDAKRIKASITIQRYLRGWLARALYQKMKYDNTLQEREIKAVIIQKFIRGWLARRFYLTLLHEHNVRKQENASIVIQRHVRFWLARKSEVRNGKILQNAARVLQKYIRGWLARLHYRNMLHELSLCRRENAAITLQRYARGWIIRQNYHKMRHEATLFKKEHAVITLQKYIRGWLVRLHYRNLLHELSLCRRENAAITLQRYARGWIIRQNYHKMRHDATVFKKECAVVTLQKYIRGWLARLHYRNLLHELSLRRRENAAVTLQRYLRGWIARRNYWLMHRKEMISGERKCAIFTMQNSTFAMECSNEKLENKICESEIISSTECLQMLRELKRQHNRLRKKRQKFLRAVENKIKFALLLKAERDRRIMAAIKIQSWWRGCLFHKHSVAIHNEIASNCIAHQKVVSNEEWNEGMQPILNRVMNAMTNLNSERLYVRYKAAKVLQKFVGSSQLCAEYVFNNGGLECVLDSLEGCNRGVGSTEVVIPLCSILRSLLKFEIIRNKLTGERQQDIVKQCYHFMLAFHRVPKVVTDLSAIIIALNGKSEQYKKAPYFIAELTKRFAKLSEYDERTIALKKLQNCILN